MLCIQSGQFNTFLHNCSKMDTQKNIRRVIHVTQQTRRHSPVLSRSNVQCVNLSSRTHTYIYIYILLLSIARARQRRADARQPSAVGPRPMRGSRGRRSFRSRHPGQTPLAGGELSRQAANVPGLATRQPLQLSPIRDHSKIM